MRIGFAATLMSVALIGSATAQQNQPDPLTPVFACAEVSGDTERLACYDRAVREVRQAANEGRFVAVDRAQVETMRRDSFGFNLPSIASLIPRLSSGDEALDELALEVQGVSTHPDGRHTFEMANGQRWTQIEPRSARNVRAGDAVTVRRASLGSYMMSSSRGGAAHRVRRVN